MLSEFFFFEADPWTVFLAQGTTCLAIGLLASYALRRRAARAHHALWIATLAAVLMPTAYWLVDRFELGVLPPETVAVEALEKTPPPALNDADLASVLTAEIAADVSTDDLLPVADPPAVDEPIVAEPEVVAEAPLAPVPVPVDTRITIPWRELGWACWVAVTTLLLGRFLLRFILGMRLVRRSVPVQDARLREALNKAMQRSGTDATVTLRKSDHVRSPIIWCWSGQPVLLVHDTAEHSGESIDWISIFCHELAHWKRRDHLTGLLAEVLTALLPWHLLLWCVRRRLMTLSEAVCDDWVVAGGHLGVDYAESLLNLSPQGQLAFLPTVVGKERAMKERIHRIVKDRCGNPRIGTAWTLAIIMLAGLITAGAALAQRRPIRRPRPEQREMQELRRAVLHEELEQLIDQARDLEAALRNRGDERGPERQELEIRLELKHQLIQAMERRLVGLERSRPPRREGRPEIEARMEELSRHQDELREHAGNLERELEALGDRHPEARERMTMELREVHENLERMEQEKIELDRLADRPPRREGRPEIEIRMEELNRHQDELREHAGNLERELEELGDRNPEARERMTMELREVHENLERMEREKIEIDQARGRARRREGRPEIDVRMDELRERAMDIEAEMEKLGDRHPEEHGQLRRELFRVHEQLKVLEAQNAQIERRAERREERPRQVILEVRELSGHLRNLRQRNKELRQELSHVDDKDSARAQDLRVAIDQTQGEMRDVENRLKEIAAPGREGRTRRQRSGDEDAVRALDALMAQIRMTEDRLHQAEEADRVDAAQRLRNVLEQLHQRREAMEARGDRRDAPRPAREGIQGRVEELQQKVDGMHDQMDEMRRMLQQLLERREEVRREVEVEVRR